MKRVLLLAVLGVLCYLVLPASGSLAAAARARAPRPATGPL